MALTKGQRKMAAVLALGGVALLVDRFVLGPSSAEAAAGEGLLVSAAEGSAVSAGAKPATRPSREGWGAQQVGSRLTTSFDRNGKPGVKSSPFHAPMVVVPAAAPASPVGPTERPGVVFARTHPLKAIMAAGRRGSAIIGDRLVREGETVDGWRVVVIAPGSVLLEHGTDRVKLGLSDSAATFQLIK